MKKMNRTARILQRASEINLEDQESVPSTSLGGLNCSFESNSATCQANPGFIEVEHDQLLLLSSTACLISDFSVVADTDEDKRKGVHSPKVFTELLPPKFTEQTLEYDSSNAMETDVENYEKCIAHTDAEEGQPLQEHIEMEHEVEECNQLQDEQLTLEETQKENKNKGRPKKGRKRKFAEQNRNIRKIKNIQNKSHFTQKGKLKSTKEFRQFLCKCDCLSKVGIEAAKQEYDKFYGVTSHDAQRALICTMVRECPIKWKRAKNSDKRNYSRQYTIHDVEVCKAFFLQTLRVSSSKINTCIKSNKRVEGVKDLRGVISGGKNKVSENRFQEVIQQIEKFPKYKSHYSREQTTCMYLRSDTTLSVMYNLYKEGSESPVSFSKYKEIFLSNFNLKRKALKKDTCHTCDKLEVLKNTGSLEDQSKYKMEKQNHLTLASETRNAMNADRKRAEEDEHLEVLTFDMEKTLPLPRIPTSVVFYKRQLWLYNLGIHTAKKNKGHCYIWLEGIAGRGAQEVGSCLLRHVIEDVEMAACKNLVLWSDSCGGQNRNIKMVLMLMTMFEVHPSLEKISLRFLTSGHSFLPNDTDFGDIECALKLQQRLYTSDDYINIMKSCKKKNPLVVHKMEKDHFFGTANIEKSIVNRKVDVTNNKINWLKFKEIEVRKDRPCRIFVKTSLKDETHQEINIEKKRGRPQNTDTEKKNSFKNLLQNLWPDGKPIAEKKLEDLRFLLPLIPKDAKRFYKNLVGDPTIEDDLDGYGQPDFDVEYEPEY